MILFRLGQEHLSNSFDIPYKLLYFKLDAFGKSLLVQSGQKIVDALLDFLFHLLLIALLETFYLFDVFVFQIYILPLNHAVLLDQLLVLFE